MYNRRKNNIKNNRKLLFLKSNNEKHIDELAKEIFESLNIYKTEEDLVLLKIAKNRVANIFKVNEDTITIIISNNDSSVNITVNDIKSTLLELFRYLKVLNNKYN